MSRDDRRRQLIEVAIGLFSQKGFEGTTTREIAHAAGVTEAVIFQHFATKNDLYRAVLEHKADVWGSEAAWAHMRELAEQRDDDGFFRFVIANTLRVMRDDRAFVRVLYFAAIHGEEVMRLFHDLHKGPAQLLIRGYIEQRQQEGVFRTMDPNTVLLALDGMTVHFGMIQHLLRSGEACADVEEQIIDRFVRIFLDGLRSGSPASSSTQAPRKGGPRRKSR